MSDERSRLLSGGQSSTYNAFPDIDPPYNDFPDFPDFPDLAHHLERIEITGVRPRYSLKATSHILFWLQAALVVLFSCFGEERFIENDNFMNIYQLFTGVEIMSLIGFGYLRTFLKRYGMGALGFTLFVTVIGLQWGILTEAFFTQVYTQSYGYVPINLVTLLTGLGQVTALLVSFGAIIGRATPLQLVVMVLCECVFYSANKSVLLAGYLGFIDAGGSIQIHLFGAYFGMAVSYMLTTTKRRNVKESSQVSDTLSLLGTMFLFIYWPSFNASGLQPNSHAQQRAVVGTIFALCASTVGTFFASSFMNQFTRKFRPVDIQNATLAGGVAVGAVCNMTLSLSDCLLIGFIAGIVSTIGFSRIQPVMERAGLSDTCGVHNLHGLPALVGGLASVVLCYTKAPLGHDMPGAFHHSNQAAIQLASIGGTLLVAIFSGLFTGLCMRFVAPRVDTTLFSDFVYWEVEPPNLFPEINGHSVGDCKDRSK